MSTFYCDFWLTDSRSKCPAEAKVAAANAHGAPLRFCAEHWSFAQEAIRAQYGALVGASDVPDVVSGLRNALMALLTDPAISPHIDRKAREQAESALWAAGLWAGLA